MRHTRVDRTSAPTARVLKSSVTIAARRKVVPFFIRVVNANSTHVLLASTSLRRERLVRWLTVRGQTLRALDTAGVGTVLEAKEAAIVGKAPQWVTTKST